MASIGYKKSNKPELVAIYRLEFYKNKKKWKFCNEKTRGKTVLACESLDTERNLALDQTYSVDQHSDVEPTDKENTSPLNNGFIHEMPYDTPLPEVAQPPPPPPTPQSTEGIWPEESFEHGVQPFLNDIWMKHEVNNQQTINDTQPQEWFNHPSSHYPQSHEAWINQGQPIDLQWLMKASGNHPEGWQPPTAGPLNQGEWTGRLQGSLQKMQDDQVSIINSPEIQPTWFNNVTNNQFNPPVWKNTPPPAGPLQNIQIKGSLASLPKTQDQNTWNQMSGLLPQGPPPNSLQMLLCPEQWKKQPTIMPQKSLDPPKINPADWTKPPPGYKPDVPDIWTGPPDSPQIIYPEFLTKPPPEIPIHLRKNPDIGTNQHNNPQKNNPDTLNAPNSWSSSRPPPLVSLFENYQKSAQNANTKSITPTSVKPSPDVWPNTQKGPATWKNPALLLNVEQQNIWTNQAWQKQQDILQNKNLDWMVTADEDVHDGVTGDDGGTADLQPQYCSDQYMKTQPSPEPLEQSPEHIRESLDLWLRRLLQVYRSDGDLETTEHYQGDDTSVEFIREAHGVPHSSETDPSEVDECICSYNHVESLAGMSPARLSSVIQHATKTLRDVLKEQLIRDRLRNRRVISLEEYPTRDTDLFGCEYVLSGSHVPRSTRALARGTDRVIKIDMGRPYRLKTHDRSD